MKQILPAFTLALAFAGVSPILHAEADIEAGKEKAEACASCHGEHGNSMVASFPKLAQQHASYLVRQLQAFKNGSRKNPMMAAIAMPLSEDDMVDIAAYYAEQKSAITACPFWMMMRMMTSQLPKMTKQYTRL